MCRLLPPQAPKHLRGEWKISYMGKRVPPSCVGSVLGEGEARAPKIPTSFSVKGIVVPRPRIRKEKTSQQLDARRYKGASGIEKGLFVALLKEGG